ncbi:MULTISPECIES: hypothetical protein [Fructobacillus]|uniref:Uncharacterized protein n=2 Tax=Fructobacillus TaxID=559173 RepID=A0ABM9ML35_9LACO|nr:hypothetical protein [Fructobacillus tropaeoli]CAK1228795.1 unnamed protein product [Fructobacillus sp. LMG 32999]CAK1222786.1 unnamed protein product [Fructobacillus tropaeoli]CAK1223611.1 unnamed protein product [Fructobacillus tropaeoli]CAK1228986.1 unnamed protein product [Fructobacillus sp. LMG 32999]CAK1231648.1 unnamed protein product [Fructobacillus sp. LMG 32999]
MTRNRIFHFVMACVWIYTFYLLMHMQDMLAMYVMAGGMFVQSLYSIIFDQKGC